MELNDLTAISPIDGRYRSKVKGLAPYFSELALIRYRVKVEILYFIALCEHPLPQLQNVDKSVFIVSKKSMRIFLKQMLKPSRTLKK